MPPKTNGKKPGPMRSAEPMSYVVAVTAIFSIAGYGRERPVAANDTDENKRKNRRIDLRFIMLTPRASVMDQIDEEIERGVGR